MRRFVTLSLISLGLLLFGCTAASLPATTERDTPPALPALGKPVAAIVGYGGYDQPRRVLRIALDGRLSTLPITPFSDSDLVLSRGGGELLYVPTPPGAPKGFEPMPGLPGAELRAFDLKTGRERVVIAAAAAAAYGYDIAGDIVVVAGAGSAHRGGFPRTASAETSVTRMRLFTIASRGASRSVDVTAPTDAALHFIAADSSAVYLQGDRTIGLGGSSQSVWRIDRESGAVRLLAEYGDADWQPKGRRWYRTSESVRLPSEEVLRSGLPVLSNVVTGCVSWGGIDNKTGKRTPGEVFYSVSDAIEFRRLPDMKVLRSIPVTEPYGTQPLLVGMPSDAARYLVKLEDVSQAGYVDASKYVPQAILERGTAAEATIVAEGPGTPWPRPIGYVGDDVLFANDRGSRTELWLWERAKRSRRLLGTLPTPEGLFGYARLLGVQYER